MKIYIDSIGLLLEPVAEQLALEGDELVQKSQEADLVLSDAEIDKQLSRRVTVGGSLEVPVAVLKAFDMPVAGSGVRGYFFVSRWFDGKFSRQTLVGVPLRGMLGDQLGEDCYMGLASRYIDSEIVDQLYNNPQFEEFFRELRYVGFVSLELSFQNDIVKASTGVPETGLYNALEGVEGKISDFLTSQSSLLLQSWVVGLVVSMAPWPYETKLKERVFIPDFDFEILKHFWSLGLKVYKRSVYTDSTLLGVATSWADTLSEATRRVTRTCRSISCSQKQYRLDIVPSVAKVWSQVQDCLQLRE